MKHAEILQQIMRLTELMIENEKACNAAKKYLAENKYGLAADELDVQIRLMLELSDLLRKVEEHENG